MNMIAPIDQPQRVRLTVEDYELLCLAHAFDRPARTELIDGAILLKNTTGPDGYPERARLTTDDFELLFEAGAFNKYGHAELVNGDIFFVNAQYRVHALAKSRLAFRLQDALRGLDRGLEVVTEVSIALPPLDEPQPDIVVIGATSGTGPIPREAIVLLVEVSDSTIRFDMAVKVPTYARHDIPELWIVDIQERIVRQFWKPVDGAYTESRDLAWGEPIASITIPHLSVGTDDLVQL